MKKNKDKATIKETKKLAHKQVKKALLVELKMAIGKFANTSKKADKIIDKAVAQLVKKLAKDFKTPEQPIIDETAAAPIVAEIATTTEESSTEAKPKTKKTAKHAS